MSPVWAIVAAAAVAAAGITVLPGAALGRLVDARRQPDEATAGRAGRLVAVVHHRAAALRSFERAGLAAGGLLILVRPALAAVVLAAALASIVAERAQSRRAETLARRAAVCSGIAAVAAALRAGLPPVTAWEAATRDSAAARQGDAGAVRDALLEPVATAARLGLDVPVALEQVAQLPGAGALRRVAVCCRVTEGAGSGLAGALERLLEGMREDEELDGVVAAELASARSTGRLLAALPLVGVAGAAALGTPPRALLLDSTVGRLCSLAAAVLEVCGLLWLRRLAASVG